MSGQKNKRYLIINIFNIRINNHQMAKRQTYNRLNDIVDSEIFQEQLLNCDISKSIKTIDERQENVF